MAQSGKAGLKAVFKTILRKARMARLFEQARSELLQELKADPGVAAAARDKALEEIKARPEVAAQAGRKALLELALRDMNEQELAILNDAFGFVEAYDYSEEMLAANRRLLEDFARLTSFAPKSLNWFVPHFDHIFRGGIRTIVAFADYFRQAKGVANRIIIYGRPKAEAGTYHREILKAFPDFPEEDVLVYDGKNIDKLPESDGAVATLWTSAFHLLKFQKTRAKFYMVQDFEPLFYPAGTIYGLIDATYRFGFWGIANTPGVGDAYQAISGAPTYSFTPGIDTSIYYPLPQGEPKHAPGEPKWVVTYGRPKNRRNCFELALRAFVKLKQIMGDKVRIISVGSEWDPREYGVECVVENFGLLGSLEELADLYRHADAGLCFMQTKHPSYQPLEYMASGCPTVTNKNPANTWLLRDGENCLLAEPTLSGVTEALLRVLTDETLSSQIVAKGLETVKGHSWEKQMEAVFDFICKKTAPTGES